MEKADRKTMLVHFDTWLTLTATMSDEQVGKLLRAAIAYARGDSEREALFGGDKVLALAFYAENERRYGLEAIPPEV